MKRELSDRQREAESELRSLVRKSGYDVTEAHVQWLNGRPDASFGVRFGANVRGYSSPVWLDDWGPAFEEFAENRFLTLMQAAIRLCEKLERLGVERILSDEDEPGSDGETKG